MDFQKTYGELGKGFIHVHHIIPLHSIKSDYIINGETDLIPVCPNCHALLHKSVDGEFMTIEELRKIVLKANKRTFITKFIYDKSGKSVCHAIIFR